MLLFLWPFELISVSYVWVSTMDTFDGNIRLQTPASVRSRAKPPLFDFPIMRLRFNFRFKSYFQLMWFDKGHGCTTRKTLTFRSVTFINACQIISYILLIAWNRILYRLAFLTGRMPQQIVLRMKVVCVVQIPCWIRLPFPLQKVISAKFFFRNSLWCGFSVANVWLICFWMPAFFQNKSLPFVVTEWRKIQISW